MAANYALAPPPCPMLWFVSDELDRLAQHMGGQTAARNAAQVDRELQLAKNIVEIKEFAQTAARYLLDHGVEPTKSHKVKVKDKDGGTRYTYKLPTAWQVGYHLYLTPNGQLWGGVRRKYWGDPFGIEVVALSDQSLLTRWEGAHIPASKSAGELHTPDSVQESTEPLLTELKNNVAALVVSKGR